MSLQPADDDGEIGGQVMERFIEMPVIGALLLLALIPQHAVKYTWRGTYSRIMRWLRSPSRVGVLLGVAFVAGVVGNQLVDELINRVDDMFDNGEQKKATCEHVDFTGQHPSALSGADWSRDAVEYQLGGQNEYARAYFERHRLFVRIDRAGAVSMALLLVSMLIYRLRKRDWTLVPIEVVILAVGLAFYASYATEEDAIKSMTKDLCVTLRCPQN